MKLIILAGAISMVLSLILTRVEISFMARRGFGQFIREDGPTTHHVKRGTPTMGGIAIISSAVLAYFLAHLIMWQRVSSSALLVVFLTLGLAFIGFLDDFIKISKERSLGLDARGKLIGQLLVGGVFALSALLMPTWHGLHPATPAISFVRDIGWLDLSRYLPWALAIALGVVWIVFIIMGTSNAVNLTDGLDGLAGGSSVFIFFAYSLISVFQFNQACWRGKGPLCYEVRDPHDLGVVAISLGAACLGFLWWNAKPARIIMGDTGSLGLGGALAGLAVMSKTELLLVVLAGLFVTEAASVMIQVASVKLRGGKRVFKMSPIHHHFELLGWNEITVVIRFWIVAAICSAVGVGIFYTEWVFRQ